MAILSKNTTVGGKIPLTSSLKVDIDKISGLANVILTGNIDTNGLTSSGNYIFKDVTQINNFPTNITAEQLNNVGATLVVLASSDYSCSQIFVFESSMVIRHRLNELEWSSWKEQTGLYSGIGEGSFQSGNDTQAIGPLSNSENYGTIAGIKGYFFVAIEFGEEIFNEDGTSTKTYGPCTIILTKEQPDDITATSIPESFEIGFAVGDELTITNDSKYPRCCKVTSVNNNVITVDALPFKTVENMGGDVACDDYQVICPDKPLAGEVNLGFYAHAEGELTQAIERAAHAEGRETVAEGQYSHAEGRGTIAYYAAHAEGKGTKAEGQYSHTEGVDTKASGDYSHTEGKETIASAAGAHAEGRQTKAEGQYSHAEGRYSHAKAENSHSEGYYNIIAEGAQTAHAENYRNEITDEGLYAHAEGKNTTIKAMGAHTEGLNTIASSKWQHVQGKYNIEDAENKYADIIGGGTEDTKRKNIQTTDWDGNLWVAGNLYAGGKSQNGGELVVTERKFIDYVEFATNVTDESTSLTYVVDENETCMTAYSWKSLKDIDPKVTIDTEDGNTFNYYLGDLDIKSNMVFPAGTYNITAKLIKLYSNRTMAATIMDLDGNVIASSGEIDIVTYVNQSVGINSKSQFGDTDFGTFVLEKPWTISFKSSSGSVGMLSFTVTRSGEKLATEEYVDNCVEIKFAEIVDSAPETLNTLNELSKALGDDPNFATTVITEIGKKVDKIEGKGLSTNDFTDDDKNKLENVDVIKDNVNSLQYYGDANIVPSDESLFTFETDEETMTASVKAASADISGDIVIPYEYVEDGKAYKVNKLSHQAFVQCSSLTSIVIPKSVVEIGEQAFASCTNLTDIVIPNSVTKLWAGGFYNCTSLTSVVIPDSVQEIGSGLFESCTNLMSVTLPKRTDMNTRYAFSRCYNLINLIIPDGVTIIKKGAFKECVNLTNITIPNSIESIETGAFARNRQSWSGDWDDTSAKIGCICYKGTRSQWNKIIISEGNTNLSSTTIYYINGSDRDFEMFDMINNLHYYCNKDITYDESLFVISDDVLTIDCSGITDGKLVIPYSLGEHTSIVVANSENITKIIIPRGINLVNNTNMTDEDLVSVFTNLNVIVRVHEDGAVLSYNISEKSIN